MDDRTIDGIDQPTKWPEHVGVAGLSQHAANATTGQRLGSSARDAIAAWSLSVARTARDFPFGEVLDHFRAVGRMSASVSLVNELEQINVPDGVGSARLTVWLRSAVDQHDGDYHTFAGTTLHEDFVRGAPFDSPEHSADVLLVTLLVDLLRVEAEALVVAPGPAQRKRTHAVVHALHRVDSLAPSVTLTVPELDDTVMAIGLRAPDDEVAEHARKAAANAGRFEAAQELVNLTMMPTTPMHDEQMFLRAIHLFECVYLLGAWKLEQATSALHGGEPWRAIELLRAVAARFEATPALYRVLTTVPRAAFAIIRKYTAGRSAIQSNTYLRVQEICAPVSHLKPTGQAPGPTLQETFLHAEDRLRPATAAALRTVLTRCDKSWRAMKRSHWGITIKTIGDARGTGNTSGADYLLESSRIPLFPAITAEE